MLDQIAETSYFGYTGIFIFLFMGQLLYLKNKIWNLFDPLILIIINISFNATIILFLFINDKIDNIIAIYVIVSTLFFCLGLNRIKIKSSQLVITSIKAFGLSPKVTVIFIFVSLFYQLIAMIFMYKVIGFGIITGVVNPDLIKVTLTQDGMGIFRHIGVAGDLLFVPLLVYAFFTYKMHRLVTVCVVFYALKFIVFPMSKSGLVFLVFDLGILMQFYKANYNYTILKTNNLILIAAAGLIPALIVLVNITATYETTIPSILINRFIVTGQGTYQYFVSGGMFVFENITIFEKFNYYFDTILSTLKIKQWEEMSYMAKMSYELTGVYSPGFGDNPYLYLDGHFLFGLCGVFYCYLIGSIIAFTRSLTCNILVFYLMVKISSALVGDPAIVQAQFFALLCYLPLVTLLYMGAKATNTQLNWNLKNILPLKNCIP